MGLFAALLLALYLGNASWRGSPAADFAVIAHRGVHQTFPREGIGRDDCTAIRIYPPTHDFIENTLPSIREAFRLGAGMVEIDIHPTVDGEFAVFHDWTIDCRTEGRGVTRRQTMAHLRTLDVGHGYTADGGRTFPLRGRGVGMMPTLGEVLAAFPDGRFLINIKSNDPTEADRLHHYLSAREIDEARLEVMGAPIPVERLRTLRPSMRMATKPQMKACLKDYVLHGWRGHIPDSCRRTIVAVPANYGWLLWGWPNLFLERMQAANSRVVLWSRVDLATQAIEGFETPESLTRLPENWGGSLFTDRIERIAPAVAAHREAAPPRN